MSGTVLVEAQRRFVSVMEKGSLERFRLSLEREPEECSTTSRYDLVVLTMILRSTRVSTETLQPMDPSNLFFVFPEVIVLAKQCREKFP